MTPNGYLNEEPGAIRQHSSSMIDGEAMNTTVRDTYLSVVTGDIAGLDVDAIVNAANSELWMGSGVAGALKRAGGEGIEREAVAQGPIEVGDAVATTGGSLNAKWVVHAAVMGPGRRPDANLIAQATTRALQVADRLGVHSLALPALGTGAGGFDIYAGATIMMGRTHEYLQATTSSGLRRVLFCAYDDVARAAFKNALAGLTRFQ